MPEKVYSWMSVWDYDRLFVPRSKILLSHEDRWHHFPVQTSFEAALKNCHSMCQRENNWIPINRLKVIEISMADLPSESYTLFEYQPNQIWLKKTGDACNEHSERFVLPVTCFEAIDATEWERFAVEIPAGL